MGWGEKDFDSLKVKFTQFYAIGFIEGKVHAISRNLTGERKKFHTLIG